MEKELVEIRMWSEYHFRRSCRELFGRDTGSDYWKWCVCRMSYEAIMEEVVGEWADYNTPFDADLYRSKLIVVETYRQKYADAIPRVIDLPGMLAEYKELRGFHRRPDIPEWVQLKMAASHGRTKMMNMTPVRCGDSDEFLAEVDRMGTRAYADRMERLYHAWMRLAREAAAAQGGKR